METTVRIDDKLYRQARDEAARVGITMTRLFEEGLQLRLARKTSKPASGHSFRVYEGAPRDNKTWSELRQLAGEDELAHEIVRLGLDNRAS